MKSLRSALRFALWLACASAVSAAPLLAAGDEWKPVNPAELALKEPVIEKDADAEVLLWEVRVADEFQNKEPRTVHTNYVRVKIFSDRGRETQGRVDIPFGQIYGSNVKVQDISARTVRPDGTVVPLKKEDIFERTIVKAGGLKMKAKSFVMPAVEPGAIIEYRWREIRGDQISFYDRILLSRDIPTHAARISVKPISLPNFPYGMRVQTFHGSPVQFQKTDGGFYTATIQNIPSFREEPHMPPQYSVRPWMLIYYAEEGNSSSPEKYWKQFGRSAYESGKSSMKAGDEVKRKAAELTAGAATPDEKLRRLFDFCRLQIKNVSDDALTMTDEERQKVRNKTPADTLKRGMGWGGDIDMLFAALATAAGFEARVARLGDREDFFFDPSFTDSYFLNTYNIAVRVEGEWRFFDPASTYVPYGMLRWQEEGQDALLPDPKEPSFVRTPLSPPEKTVERRTAKLKLGDDGTLSGDVKIEYTGHLAARMKETFDDDSPAQREEALKNSVKSRLGGAEISDIRIENVTDPDKPFVYQFRVEVPGYAQRTGKRLLLQPAFFRYGLGPVFPTSERRHDAYFHFPWAEEDEVEINLPDGFALDNAESPNAVSTGKASQYQPSLGLTKDGRTLVYTRKFYFNGSVIPSASYGTLKSYFDEVHKQDTHGVVLKAAAAAAKAGQD
jgi:hypothetical protein